ncbi:DUF4166 domain-containing protein [Rossellomorea aquimaris]|uniref:DUF4166 domain-containing protein n=1 Tax=Rossellomorea aquimaris TaxID=189382 RepID=UPI001CD200C4|nr:DUF4166 domain-containing protein [Rossellomorea aquimaris]MCA1054120.1 DUF4166 domain-containing protein [Rossellomorea aquimaris]
MTIYQDVLGEDFKKLHPKLQERYRIPIGKPFKGIGTMKKIERGSFWLTPFLKLAVRWRFLFPESGENIPFKISNTSRTLPAGETEIYWERSFHFDKVTRHFNAFMTIDPKRDVVRDFLGEPRLFYSDLILEVTPEGRMRIKSGSQRIIVGKLELPLPPRLRGVVTVEEGYDDARGTYTIRVDIRNELIGRVMTYEGEFKEQST